MKFSILTLFPEMFDVFLKTSIIKRAIDDKIISFNIYNLMDTVAAKVRVDAHAVGPGPGMVIKPEVIEAAITHCENSFGSAFKIFLSPQGQLLTQKTLRLFFKKHFNVITNSNKSIPEENSTECKTHFILVCSRYEGIDNRAEEYYADMKLSIGDYVLMGGELPAQVFLEALIRLIPGVVGNNESLLHESFETPFFDHPNYCKPDIWKNKELPSVLLSGNHAEIFKWRLNQSIQKTLLNRFDWFKKHREALSFIDPVQKILPSHYCVIMHDKVLNKEGLIGTTSIKSMDLHDISRAAISFGFKKFFVVQPLKDQQSIAKEFFSFWTDGKGEAYNQTRYVAIERIDLCDSLEEVKKKILEIEGKDSILISTSALDHEKQKTITYHDQGLAWGHDQPILIILGTGYGLSPEIINQSDYVLAPIKGLSNYNHLSVRAAAAIIFDRWLGISPD